MFRSFDLHFGIFSPPVSGHLHPFGALGRELIRRGHRVSLIHMPDLEDRTQREKLEFIAIGRQSHPRGSLARSLGELGRLKGLSALRFTIRQVEQTTRMMLEEAPDAIRAAGIEFLLVDQTEPAGGAVAEHLRLPFVTVCNALAMNREPAVPPPFTPWPYSGSLFSRARNQLGYAISDRFTASLLKVVNRYRRAWRIPDLRSLGESFSPLAQISQQPEQFDFPRRDLPANFHYAGPLRGPLPAAIPFPWNRLDRRPLIYASLGTLQNNRLPVFRCFAEACRRLDVQLVITHGGGLTDAEVDSLPGAPVVVGYAPQLEVISRAALTLSHAGLNTVLDALSCGVPVLAVPVTYEQPAIAQRLRYTGTGEAMGLSRLDPNRLRERIRVILSIGSYQENAARMARAIGKAGGTAKAADIILDCVEIKKGTGMFHPVP